MIAVFEAVGRVLVKAVMWKGDGKGDIHEIGGTAVRTVIWPKISRDSEPVVAYFYSSRIP